MGIAVGIAVAGLGWGVRGLVSDARADGPVMATCGTSIPVAVVARDTANKDAPIHATRLPVGWKPVGGGAAGVVACADFDAATAPAP